MDLERALQTTGAVRDFADHPVPDEVVFHILDVARYAPSGGNRQAWKVILVKDQSAREKLRDLYLRGWYRYLAIRAAGLVPWAPITDRAAEAEAERAAENLAAEAAKGPGGMAENLDKVPALLVLLADLKGLAAVDRDMPRYTMVGGASIYPFAWSILLAAHNVGIGGVFTTMLVSAEQEVLDILDVPEGWALAGALALGYPEGGRRPTKLSRAEVATFATVDRFDGPVLEG
ncbi:MAG TPA: nitroreductase family protein [Acidimicrobiales bacterium]|nr:nitroreductase family protein [Acidimicrobiales bacterium]